MTFDSSSPLETEQLGELIGSLLTPASTVALYGDLGGGKTCFTRGLVKGVAPQSAHLVASPTYSIMNEYAGTPPVYHFDFYRTSGSSELVELGFDDYFNGDGICVIEWPERIEDALPPNCIKIHFDYLDDLQRKITIETAGNPKTVEILELLTTHRQQQKKL